MLALKAFVQESVQELDDTKLHVLAETLRIDVRGCDDRRDLERVVIGLLCLDQDTSLGVFLSWLRTSDASGAFAPKKPFHNTFVPKIAPTYGANQQQPLSSPLRDSISATAPERVVKEHHLSEEIQTQLRELQQLEHDFKAAERVVHAGTPSFDKLKQFLVALTLLRSKEEATRRQLVQQNALLAVQHREMRAETLHTRAQLDFFVDGFANLRQRHDALLEKSTQSHAESEAAQDVLIAMASHESHFAAIMAHTLMDQRAQNAALQTRLDAAHASICTLEAVQVELRATISALKQARGDASKDAHCYKRQLRACKRKLTALEHESADGRVFRAQAMALRQSFVSLLGYLRDAVLRDTKTPKQAISKEALRIIHRALDSSVVATTELSSGSSLAATAPSSLSSTVSDLDSPAQRGASDVLPLPRPSTPVAAIDISHNQRAAPAVPRVLAKRVEAQQDLDEVVRGVLLLGSAESESAVCAALLSARLRYAAVDVRAALESFQNAESETRRLHAEALASRDEHEPQASVSTALTVTAPKTLALRVPDSSVADRLLQVTTYGAELRQLVIDAMARRGARGFVLFNWEFTSQDANVLLALGLPVDSVLDLQPAVPPVLAAPRVPPPQLVQAAKLPSPTPPSPSSQQQQQRQQPGTSARSQVGARTPAASPVKLGDSKALSASGKKTAAPSSAAIGSDSPAKPAPASPSRAPSRQAVPKTPEMPTSATASSRRTEMSPPKSSQQQQQPTSLAGKRPAATLSSSLEKRTNPPAAEDRKARFPGMLHLFERVAPASFPEERIERILDALAVQRAKRATPLIQWDEATQRTNELLGMFAEDVHMMLFVEQENRKPKKPGGADSSATAGSGTRASNSTSPAKPTGDSASRTTSPSRAAPSPGKQLARGSSRSPAKPTATAHGSGAAAVATSRRATATALSPTAHQTPVDTATAAPMGSNRIKRASVTTSSPSAKLVPSKSRK